MDGSTRVDASQLPMDTGVRLLYRTDRALLELTGKDRIDWLHNLTTNQIRTLQPGDGVYAFVLNLQGRILFDVNILVRSDSVLLDLDRGFLETALAHFEKYRITENVQVHERSDACARVALIGEAGIDLLTKLGAGHLAKMPQLGTAEIRVVGRAIQLLRHDFCGPFAVECLAPTGAVQEFVSHLEATGGIGIIPSVDMEDVRVRSIEAGIPWPQREICDQYLPAETGQLERAVSFNKGCYLGQEVVERMRSRGVLARRLVGLRFDGHGPLECPVELFDAAGKSAGTVTTVALSARLGGWIGLGYVKTAADGNSALTFPAFGGRGQASLQPLPFIESHSS